MCSFFLVRLVVCGISNTRVKPGLSRGSQNRGEPRATPRGGAIVKRLIRHCSTGAFAQPTDYTYGKLAANLGTVRSPGMIAVDATLAKDFCFTEAAKLQMRWSVFRLVNHPVFQRANLHHWLQAGNRRTSPNREKGSEHRSTGGAWAAGDA